MKKTLSIVFICLSALLILDSANFGHALMLFVLAGIVPGTNLVMSPSQMLELFSLLIGIVIGRISARLMFAVINRLAAQYSQPKAATLAE